MKTLKFENKLAFEILAGRKDATWRIFDEKNLSVGDELELVNSDTGNKFADAKILNVSLRKLGEIEENDFDGHEKFKSKQEMLETYRKYYGDKVDWDTEVKMIKFKLL